MAAATSVCASVTSRSAIKTAKSRSLTQTTLLVSQFSDAKDIHAIRMGLDSQRGREMQDRLTRSLTNCRQLVAGLTSGRGVAVK